MIKKTILFDLDGVLNTYDGKYYKNYIPPIKEGAYSLIQELSKDYKIVIFTVKNTIYNNSFILTSKYFAILSSLSIVILILPFSSFEIYELSNPSSKDNSSLLRLFEVLNSCTLLAILFLTS